jgi:general secretion pathway protein L
MTLWSFLSWWRDQLASLLPAGLRDFTSAGGKTTRVTVDGDRRLVEAPGLETPRALKAGDPQISGLGEATEKVALRIGPGEFLVRRFGLPRVALPNLGEAVGYQIPKLMPFNRDQVLFACGVDSQPRADGQASVWLVAVPRRKVADALDLLGIPLPDNPFVLPRPPAPDEPLEFSWRPARAHRTRARVQRGLWIGLAAVWLVAIALIITNQQRAYTELQAQHDTLRQEAVAVGRLRERLDLAQAQFDDLVRRRQDSVSPLQLFNELTEALDDKTWLINLELQEDRLSMQGVSSAPAALIETLEDTALLRGVQFDAAITQAGRGEGSRFNISARTVAAPSEMSP